MTDDRLSRITWVDFAKGLAMILVVAGHTIQYGDVGIYIKGIINSFHMPLFFLLSGYTFHHAASVAEFFAKCKKGMKYLLLPSMIIYLLKLVYAILFLETDFLHIAFLKKVIYTLLFFNPNPFEFAGLSIPSIGYIWFIAAFFMCKTFYDFLQLYLNKNYLLICTCIFSILGYLISFHTLLPLGIGYALTLLPLIYVGSSFHNIDFSQNALKKTILYFLLWLLLFALTFPNAKSETYLHVATQRYTLYPICFICAICGTLFVCECSYFATKFKLSCCISFIGKYSLYFLFAHYFDTLFEGLWKIGNDQYLRFFIRLSIDILIFFIILGFVTLFKKISSKNRVD